LYKIPANTLFTGKRIVFVPECHSTNTLAMNLAENSSTTEGTVVITANQTAGRGQRGNSWEAEPGKNLTFSIVLRPGFLAIKDQFYLTICISLAIRDYVARATKLPSTIKWPNDILVHEKKICGILIENQVQASRFVSSVAGIGLNVNQTNFSALDRTSLKAMINKEIDLETALHELLQDVEARYLQLKEQNYSDLKEAYLQHLHSRNQSRLFQADDQTFEGTISGIDESGKLAISTKQGLRYFGIKEVSFLK
jgi:BirA family transcriptional regulator, biotin operon repressor / biotin---[acetyl-CoA-carboxylase] ligase